MEESCKIIVFQVKKESYGVDLHQILSIERLQTITPVPKTPDYIKGVLNLRGEIIPVIDLNERIHSEKINPTDENRILIVEIQNMRVGLVVDAATDVIDVELSSIEPPPSIIGGVTQDYVKGVIRRENNILILLDLERVLNLAEIDEIQDVHAQSAI